MIKNTPFQRIAFDDTFAKVKELIGDKKEKNIFYSTYILARNF